jgi:hypothetical protein
MMILQIVYRGLCFTASPSDKTMIVPLPTYKENTHPYFRAYFVNLG